MTGAALLRADSLALPIADRSVWLSISSPPYFALRSYQDGGEHYGGQIGSEPHPNDFLRALWRVYDEVWRTLRDDGSAFVNLGDKYAGSGGHNNAALMNTQGTGASTLSNRGPSLDRMSVAVQRARDVARTTPRKASRRSAPDRYNQAADVLAKSLMGLPWRFAMGLIDPVQYRNPIDPPPSDCWHEDQPCGACRPGSWPQWILRAEVVWSKPNGMPESVTDRVRRSHEQWFHLVKTGRYYTALDELREPQKHLDHPQVGKSNHLARQWSDDDARAETSHGSLAGQVRLLDPRGRLPGSVTVMDDVPLEVPPEVWAALGADDSATVWSVPSEPLIVPDHIGVDHFAAFPQEWPRRLIVGWSPPGVCTVCGDGRRPTVDKAATGQPRGQTVGDQYQRVRSAVTGGDPTATDVSYTITGYACACPTPDAPTTPATVLDPFGGTGTTAMVARALGRFGVHVDLSADYLRLARWRVFDSGHAAKSVRKTNAEAKATGAAPASMPAAGDSLFEVDW